MTEPKYFDITEDMITAVERGSATVRIIGGSFDGQDGRAQGGYVKADLLDVAVAPGGTPAFPTDAEKMYLCISSREARASGMASSLSGKNRGPVRPRGSIHRARRSRRSPFRLFCRETAQRTGLMGRPHRNEYAGRTRRSVFRIAGRVRLSNTNNSSWHKKGGPFTRGPAFCFSL